MCVCMCEDVYVRPWLYLLLFAVLAFFSFLLFCIRARGSQLPHCLRCVFYRLFFFRGVFLRLRRIRSTILYIAVICHRVASIISFDIIIIVIAESDDCLMLLCTKLHPDTSDSLIFSSSSSSSASIDQRKKLPQHKKCSSNWCEKKGHFAAAKMRARQNMSLPDLRSNHAQRAHTHSQTRRTNPYVARFDTVCARIK